MHYELLTNNYFMSYVDGYVIIVPKAKRAAYKKMAKEGKEMWMKLGALDYKECRIEDPKAPWCKSFIQLAKPKADEEVWFSYVVYKDKKDRTRINKDIQAGMADWEKKNGKKTDMPFNMKKMTFGGFVAEVE